MRLTHAQYRELFGSTPKRITRSVNKRPIELLIKSLKRQASGGLRAGHNQLILTFPDIRLASWNVLIDAHWADRNRYAIAWHKLIADTLLNHKAWGKYHFDTVDITVTQCVEHHPLDRDNISAKAPIDGLRRAGLMPDDNPSVMVGYQVEQVVGDNTAVIFSLTSQNKNIR